MRSKASRVMLAVCALSSVVLALSFFLPLAKHTTYLREGGSPAGILDQLFPAPDTAAAVTHEFFWSDPYWVVPALFFLPGGLCLALLLAPDRVRRVLAAVTPFLAGYLFVVLLAMVQMADFGINNARALGGYVALGALGAFVTASVLLAGSVWSEGRVRAPRNGSMA